MRGFLAEASSSVLVLPLDLVETPIALTKEVATVVDLAKLMASLLLEEMLLRDLCFLFIGVSLSSSFVLFSCKTISLVIAREAAIEVFKYSSFDEREDFEWHQ